MKLSLGSIILSLFLASACSAFPVGTHQRTANPNSNAGSRTMGAAKGAAAGAAYFITNEASGNMIIAADINSDGSVTLRRAIDAGGIGAHGITSPIGPDPLFAQGSIKASAAGNIVATVNSGSNTISLFNIDPTDATNLQMIGKPVGSNGQFPISLAINKAGNSVCALNGGEINGVSCFKVDKTAGLVPISNTVRSLNLSQTTPATGPAGSASHIVFSENNSQLIASVKGVPPQPGFLALWDVAADGSLSADFTSVAPQAGGLLPFSMTVIAGQNALLATDAGLGFDIFDLAAVNAGTAASASTSAASATAPAAVPAVSAVAPAAAPAAVDGTVANSTTPAAVGAPANASSGAVNTTAPAAVGAAANVTASAINATATTTVGTAVNASTTVGNATVAVAVGAVNSTAAVAVADRSSANAIAGQSATCWSSFSPKTGNFFLTDIGTATVTEVNVDANLKGTIVKQYPQAAGSGTIDNDVATIGSKDFLYVLAANTSSIDVLSLVAPGQAKSIQRVDIAGPAKAAGITVNPNNLQGMTTFVRA